VTSRVGDEDAEVAVDLQASHRSFAEHTAELSMKAPLSVSKLADLGVGVPSYASRINGNKDDEHGVLPRFGPS
jgi:hypothetical protein